MKIALLDLAGDGRPYVCKDLAGGFGTKLVIGPSLRAKWLEWVKTRCVRLPVMAYGYLAAIFRLARHDVEYIQNDLERAAKADMVFTWTSLVEYEREREAVRELKKRGAPSVGVIGPVASLFPENYEGLADFVVIGEPESAAMHLAERGSPLTGKIISPPVKRLEDIPFPNWEGFPVESYSYFPALNVKPILPVLGNRGCFAPCEYCAYRTNYHWRIRPPENLVDELRHLKRQYGIRGVLFRDPMFTGRQTRAEIIAQLMIEKKLDLEWACETALEFLDENLIDLLHSAGLRAVNVGIESGSDAVLNDVQRRTQEQRRSEHLVAYCRKKGIHVAAFYCIGLPQDTEETIRHTIEYATQLNTDVATFNVFTPYPGTPLYERVKHEIFEHRWEQYTSYTPVWRHPLLSSERLEQLREEAYLSFYFRPQYFASLVLGGHS